MTIAEPLRLRLDGWVRLGRGVGVAACVCLCACSGEPDRTAETTDAGTPPDASTIDPLPSTCEQPDRPAPLDHDGVVGDGTPESCTRDALAAVVAGGGNVTFDCGAAPVTISFDAEVEVPVDTIIDGGGLVTLDGGGSARLLVSDSYVVLTVIGLGFTRGRATTTADRPEDGGAILGGWRGTVQVFDCAFVENVAGPEPDEGGGAIFVSSGSTLVVVGSTFLRNSGGLGGAIYNMLSGLTVVSSVFEDNVSHTAAGAIMTDGASEEIDDEVGGQIDLCGCSFSRNSGTQEGGGVYLFAYPPDELVVNQCLFEENAVTRGVAGGALGGGLRPGNAPLHLANSLFVGNHADSHGGGIWVDGSYLSLIENCTFTLNTTGVEGGDDGYGGAISGGNLALRNVTIVDNHAVSSGGAVFNEQGAPATMDNCLLANNTAGNQWGLAQSCRSALDGSHNLQFPAPTGEDIACTADVITDDPLLGELSDNGGPTMTIPLLSGSPAIDVGEGCLETDQRGLPRTGACDLGAFEAQ